MSARSLLSARRALLAVGAATAAVLAGCGNEIPRNSVAKVHDSPIEKTSFDRWFGTVARAQQQSLGAPAATTVPDPPNFDKCVAAKRRPAPGGGGLPPVEQSRQECRNEFEALKGQVMQFLINAEWIEQEGEERDIELSEEEVRRNFDDQKRKAFPDDKQYRQFLAQSGQSEEDILYRVRLDMLVNAVQKNVVEGKREVSDQEVRDYYNRNRARFGQPDRRELRVVLADDETEARKVTKALDDGRPIERVVQRYSIAEPSKREGGKLNVKREQQDKALEEAAFKARPGQIVGPVKTDFGAYVFRLDRALPPTQRALPQATEEIKQIVRSQKEQRALEEFVRDFERRHKEETLCSPGYVVRECRNGPKGPPPGQQQPGQGGPPGQQQPPGQGGPGGPQGTGPEGGPPTQQDPPGQGGSDTPPGPEGGE
ncbi:MAG: peptidyl-prolyl cis-trans isomerase [Thermoleophilaceae bacterium]